MHNSHSHRDVRQALDPAPASHRHCHGLFQTILRQELVLRDRPLHRDSCMLLRRGKSRRIPRPYQKCRFRITPHVQPYVRAILLLRLIVAQSYRMIRGGVRRQKLSLGQLKASRDGVLSRERPRVRPRRVPSVPHPPHSMREGGGARGCL